MIYLAGRKRNYQIETNLAQLVIAAASARTPKGDLGAVSSRGWYKRTFRCPCGQHNNDDRRPSASIKRDGSMYCHTTARWFNTNEAAALLGVTVPESESFPNRSKRRSQAKHARMLARANKRRLFVATAMTLPKHLRGLMRLLIHESQQFGTVAMSHGSMAMQLRVTRETVNRQIQQLRALGFSKCLGYYIIGTAYHLWHAPLSMRVCIEAVVFDEENSDIPHLAVDSCGRCHTMSSLEYRVQNGLLPKFVFLLGLPAFIHYEFCRCRTCARIRGPDRQLELALD